MPTATEAPQKPRKFTFTKDNARLYQERQAVLRRTRKDAEQFDSDLASKAEAAMPTISNKVRTNLALSLLRQSTLVSGVKIKNYDSVVGSKGKTGLMDALASLASSADKVFQWSQEQSASMIVNGSFTVIQAPGTPSCGVAPTTSSMPAIIECDSTPQSEQVVDNESDVKQV